MSEKSDYFSFTVGAYVDAVIEAAPDKQHVMLLLERLAKEVSRDTRHEAALHGEIFNLDMNE